MENTESKACRYRKKGKDVLQQSKLIVQLRKKKYSNDNLTCKYCIVLNIV